MPRAAPRARAAAAHALGRLQYLLACKHLFRSTATADGLTQDLAALMRHLLVRTGRDFFVEIERTGVSLTQVKTLGLLAEAEEPMSVKALSDAIGLSLPGVSRAVDGLVQIGALARQQDARDRRSKLLTVTSRGRRIYERLLAVRLAGVWGFVEELDPTERRALADGLAAVAGRLHR
jgi:DNA-binding MarR family transcriptional regulator